MLNLRRRFDRFLDRRSMMGIASFFKPNLLLGMDQAAWNRDYAKGDWDDLGQSIDMYRYPVVAGYIQSLGPAASVLDIGCGSGILAERLCEKAPRPYLGVDISTIAIDKALARGLANARFEVADAVTFNPGRQFSAIVFNEILCYIDDPARLLTRLSASLAPGGAYVISLYRSIESMQAWRRSAPHLEVLSETRIRAFTTYEWKVRLCRPRSRAAK